MTEAAVIAFALENPAYGPERASNELRKRAVFISPSGVRCVWLRHELSTFKGRLMALERQMAESGGMVLTEALGFPGPVLRLVFGVLKRLGFPDQFYG